jgi:hypothetical protein
MKSEQGLSIQACGFAVILPNAFPLFTVRFVFDLDVGGGDEAGLDASVSERAGLDGEVVLRDLIVNDLAGDGLCPGAGRCRAQESQSGVAHEEDTYRERNYSKFLHLNLLQDATLEAEKQATERLPCACLAGKTLRFPTPGQTQQMAEAGKGGT